MAEKIVAKRRSHIVDRTVAVAVTSFELGSQRPAGSEASGVVFCRPGGGGNRRLRKDRGAKAQKRNRQGKSCEKKSKNQQFPKVVSRARAEFQLSPPICYSIWQRQQPRDSGIIPVPTRN